MVVLPLSGLNVTVTVISQFTMLKCPILVDVFFFVRLSSLFIKFLIVEYLWSLYAFFNKCMYIYKFYRKRHI